VVKFSAVGGSSWIMLWMPICSQQFTAFEHTKKTCICVSVNRSQHTQDSSQGMPQVRRFTLVGKHWWANRHIKEGIWGGILIFRIEFQHTLFWTGQQQVINLNMYGMQIWQNKPRPPLPSRPRDHFLCEHTTELFLSYLIFV